MSQQEQNKDAARNEEQGKKHVTAQGANKAPNAATTQLPDGKRTNEQVEGKTASSKVQGAHKQEGIEPDTTEAGKRQEPATTKLGAAQGGYRQDADAENDVEEDKDEATAQRKPASRENDVPMKNDRKDTKATDQK